MTDYDRRYIFFGTVLPARTNISVDRDPFVYRTEGGEMEIDFAVYASEISIIVSTNKDWEILTLRNHIRSIVEDYVNILAYTHGYSCDVEISSVILPNNDRITFSVEYTPLREVLEDLDKMELSENIAQAIGGEDGMFLRRALSDFRDALIIAEETSFYCYRALESLRHIYAEDSMETSEEWDTLWEELKMDNTTALEIKKIADELRHGKPQHMPAEVRKKHIQYTWEAIHRHVEKAVSQ